MTFADAMKFYGSDNPDIRFEMKFADFTRLHQFLVVKDKEAASLAMLAIQESFLPLERFPMIGRLVDDNTDLLALLQRHLKADYEVITAPDGESALAMLKGGAQFDAIISDLQMPGIYGVTFLHEAKRIAPNTPSIILTGRNDPITLATARKSSGAEWILFKPYSKQELLAAIKDATQRPRDGTSGAPGAHGP